MAKNPGFVNSCNALLQESLPSSWCPLLGVQTVSLTFQSSALCSFVLSYKLACEFLMPPRPFCAKHVLSLPAVHALFLTRGSGVPNTGPCSRPQSCEQHKCLFDGRSRKEFSLGEMWGYTKQSTTFFFFPFGNLNIWKNGIILPKVEFEYNKKCSLFQSFSLLLVGSKWLDTTANGVWLF